MTLNSNSREALARFLASLGHLLMTLVAGEDQRVRWAIARTVTRTRPAHGFDLQTRRGNRPDLAANSRVE